MKCRSIVAALTLPLFVLSCTHLAQTVPSASAPRTQDGELLKTLRESEHRELLKAASQRLDLVRKHLRNDDMEAADAALKPLVGQGIFTEEVDALRTQITGVREKRLLDVATAQSVQRSLSEVEQRLVLPRNYNSTVVIEGSNTGPIAIPTGPMEELFKRRVDINIQNAGVKELVQALTKIEGLNIIADDALEAENALTINVRNTPLTEILSYIARNMGVAFHVGENIVWVTESDEEPGSGPKLEVQIYKLRQGFVPTLDSSGGMDDMGGGGGGDGGGTGAEDSELEDALSAILSDSPDGATYRIFRHRNLLMVKDTRENLRLVELLLENFDKAPLQVLIEARFITIGQDDLRDVGAELTQTVNLNEATTTTDNPNYDPLVPGSQRTITLPNPSYSPLDPSRPEMLRVDDLLSVFGAAEALKKAGEYGQVSLGGVIAGRTFNVLISAIESATSTTTLSAPRVTVLNNHKARIRRGDKVLYYDELETVAASGGGQGGSAATQTAFSGTPKELELGVTLEVKVNVGNDGKTIMLALMPEVIELKRWRQFSVVAARSSSSRSTGGGSIGGIGGNTAIAAAPGQLELPETTESIVTTSVAVRSGETVVLGGLVNLNRQSDVKKVPILGDLPWVGFFFRRTKDKDVPLHLLIFVTASVVDEWGRFVDVNTGGE